MEQANTLSSLEVPQDVDDYIGSLLDEIHDLKQEKEEAETERDYYKERLREEGMY